jgi:hypothetical protein
MSQIWSVLRSIGSANRAPVIAAGTADRAISQASRPSFDRGSSTAARHSETMSLRK